jgi:hypothetical protein
MKKCLSLLAILGLFLLVSSTFAAAPVFQSIPSVKLFISRGLTPAFDLANYNSGDPIVTASIITGAPYSSVSGTNVNYAAYGSATTFVFAYSATNAGGTGYASNKAKWSTYKFGILPNVTLSVGAYADVNVGSLVANASGPAIPASFGYPGALAVSDTTKVAATWQNSSVLRIQLNNAISAPVNVDITAAIVASAPFGADIDKGRIQVFQSAVAGTYPNASSVTTNLSSDASSADSITTPITPVFVASQADLAGNTITGVAEYDFTGTGSGVKATAGLTKWTTYNGGQWYIARVRLFSPNAGNDILARIYNFNGNIGVDPTIDISANLTFGVPTVWTWLETPLFTRVTTTSGYPQIWLSNGSAGQKVYIGEVQVVPFTPPVFGANATPYSYLTRGNFTTAAYSTYAQVTGPNGWSPQSYDGSIALANGNVVNGTLQLDFVGATSAANKGTKYTGIGTTVGTVYTQAVTPGQYIGFKADVGLVSGNFNDYNAVIQFALFGVSSNGGNDYTSPGGSLWGTGELGVIKAGTIKTGVVATQPYYQLQFSAKNGQAGVLSFNNIDFLVDNDTNIYANGSLF